MLLVQWYGTAYREVGTLYNHTICIDGPGALAVDGPYQYVVQIAPRLFDANRGQPVHGLLVLMDKKRFFSCFVRIRLHLRIGLLVLGKVSAVPGGRG